MRTKQLTSRRSPVTALLMAAVIVAPLSAQTQTGKRSTLDRTKQPEIATAPALRVPTWTKTALPNGAQLIVSQKPGLPLVSVTMSFVGGRHQFDDAAKVGTAALTAQMLTEGTTTRSGDQFADAQQMLGTSIQASISGESGQVRFTALASKLEPALELMADMLLNPAFPADALERRRGVMLVNITQAKDQPNAIAANVFSRVLYGDAHPYGRVATEGTVKAVTRDDIVAFHRAYYQPGRAVITVVGDVDPARVRAAFEKAFANWQPGGERPSFAYPQPPALRPRTIYLVDKPKAAQSVFGLGVPGPSRDTPDFYAIEVMNKILGDLFQSRLNHLIREVRGFSYGVGSGFNYGRGPGAFQAGGSIVTAKSDSALMDFMNELRGVQGGKPFTEDEIKQGKESLIQGVPQEFASVNATSGAISSIYVQGLPETYYQEYASKVNAVTSDDLMRVAKKYIDLDNINIVIVGDRATIEEPLRKTGIAPIVLLDIEGKPVPAVTP
jgi:zinc protease